MSKLKNYIGVKLIKAAPASKNGKEGYEVVYANPDGTSYTSWSPADVFERAYFPIEYEDRISDGDIQAFLESSEVLVETRNGKTTLVEITTPTGWEDLATSSCVSPENYDKNLGKKYALEHIKNRLWKHFGFLLQWARYGLK
ncbi:MAG: Gp49 family protein [Pseudomonadota bacterium]